MRNSGEMGLNLGELGSRLIRLSLQFSPYSTEFSTNFNFCWISRRIRTLLGVKLRGLRAADSDITTPSTFAVGSFLALILFSISSSIIIDNKAFLQRSEQFYNSQNCEKFHGRCNHPNYYFALDRAFFAALMKWEDEGRTNVRFRAFLNPDSSRRKHQRASSHDSFLHWVHFY